MTYQKGLKYEDFSVTISIGISGFGRDINTSEKILKAADNARYEAKDKGKNRVIMNKEMA